MWGWLFGVLFWFFLIRKSSKTLMAEVEFGVVWVAQVSLPF